LKTQKENKKIPLLKSELKKNILLVIHGGLEETRETG